jgi:hypothetical protein
MPALPVYDTTTPTKPTGTSVLGAISHDAKRVFR